MLVGHPPPQEPDSSQDLSTRRTVWRGSPVQALPQGLLIFVFSCRPLNTPFNFTLAENQDHLTLLHL